jgi:hypothetical protein
MTGRGEQFRARLNLIPVDLVARGGWLSALRKASRKLSR